MQDISPLPEADGELAVIPAEPLAPARPSSPNHKWTAAFVVSGLLHATVAAAFLIAPEMTSAPRDSSQIEGADQSGDMVAGNGTEQQSAAGSPAKPDVTPITLVAMPEPKPARVEAQPVQTTQTVEPTDDAKTETPVAETAQPTLETTQQPVASVDTAEPEASEPAATDPRPEVLTAEASSDDGFTRKSPTPSQKVELAKPAKADPAKADPAQTDPARLPATDPAARSQQADPPTDQDASKEQKPVAKPARARSKPGSGGNDGVNVPMGQQTGANNGRVVASLGGKKSLGNASASNYPGKVAAKLRQVQRAISKTTRAKLLNNAKVSFVIDESGNIAEIKVVTSSGSPDFDQAAIAIVRKASPFPPIPPDAGRTSWAFSLPIGPF